MTEPQMGGTYDELLRAARLAESEGLYFVRPFRSSRLGAASRLRTRPTPSPPWAVSPGTQTRCGSAVLVTPITFRHPAIIAKNAVTIDQMSGGRFDLGVGTGWNDFEHDALGISIPRGHGEMGPLRGCPRLSGGSVRRRARHTQRPVLQPRSRRASEANGHPSDRWW